MVMMGSLQHSSSSHRGYTDTDTDSEDEAAG
jgi:hypothetical protein